MKVIEFSADFFPLEEGSSPEKTSGFLNYEP